MLDAKLDTFLAVVENGSYTAAAKAINLTQPAVSQHIAKLEHHYACTFFQAEGRGLSLTSQGHLFYQYAKQQRANEVLLRTRLQDMLPRFRIGSTFSIADYYLPDLLVSAFETEGSAVEMVMGNTEQLLTKLAEGELDCAFIEGLFDQNRFCSYVFKMESFLPVVSSVHPLAGKKVSLPELFSYPLIVREEGSGTRAILEHYLLEQHAAVSSFKQVWEIGNFMVLKKMLQNSNAISFMYRAVAAKEVSEGTLCYLDIEAYDMQMPLHFVYQESGLLHRRAEKFYHQYIKNAPAKQERYLSK